MSSFKVEIIAIDNIMPHPNADKLELAQVKGWNCVIPKGRYKPKDLCIYIPIDSVLPEFLENIIFPPSSKVKLNNHRVKTIKLRGAISQGLVVPLATLENYHDNLNDFKEGDDVTGLLGIQKYEPPVKEMPTYLQGKAIPAYNNPNFNKYGGIDNFKNYPNLFEDGELVSITEKIHGTNFRCGYVKYHPSTFFKKVKKVLGLAPKYEFVYGSNNVQLQDKLLYNGYYDNNVYAATVNKYRLKECLKPGEVIYGEIYGDGIQKGYNYGCEQGEHKLVVFDLKRDDKYVNVDEFLAFCKERGFISPPELYRGPFNKDLAKKLTEGNSVLCHKQAIREGVVIKPLEEKVCLIGRKMLKLISDDYLIGDQTDFH